MTAWTGPVFFSGVNSEIAPLRSGTKMEPPILRQSNANKRLSKLRLLVAFGRRYAWKSLKNCAAVLFGRKTYLDEEALFFRQCVLHLIGLKPIRKITCPGLRGEGAGSQALMIMKTINFARLCGLTYVHTPFTRIEHAERPMEEWATSWETFFNLGAGEVVCDTARQEVVNFSANCNNLERCFGWYWRRDEFAHHFKTMVPEFRRKYYLNKSSRTTDEVTVAVHIRRGDVLPDNQDYFTSNETVLRTITAIKQVFDIHQVKHRISIYSQGSRADFAQLSLPNVEFFLDVDAIWTMEELIEADILVMAKCCFSYYAALICDGIKIGDPDRWFISPTDSWIPTDGWVPCRADGSFDSAAFERQLLALIEAKALPATKAESGGTDRKSILVQHSPRTRGVGGTPRDSGGGSSPRGSS
jgi:hypothetical protein